jgi:hypothetical protein
MSELVEEALRARMGAQRRLMPLPDRPALPVPEVVDALADYGAPLWSDGRPTRLSLEEAVAQGLALARQHPSLLRVLPVVLYKNRSRLSWPELRARVDEGTLPALGMLLDLTAEVTGIETFRTWAEELFNHRGQQENLENPAPFFEGRPRGRRYAELARQRTPDVVRRWGFLMATPIDDFRDAVVRYCLDDRESSIAPT